MRVPEFFPGFCRFSTACFKASSASLRSVMSREIPNVPTTSPRWLRNAAWSGHPGNRPIGQVPSRPSHDGLARSQNFLLIRQRRARMLLRKNVEIGFPDRILRRFQANTRAWPIDQDEPRLPVLEIDMVRNVPQKILQEKTVFAGGELLRFGIHTKRFLHENARILFMLTLRRGPPRGKSSSRGCVSQSR